MLNFQSVIVALNKDDFKKDTFKFNSLNSERKRLVAKIDSGKLNGVDAEIEIVKFNEKVKEAIDVLREKANRERIKKEEQEQKRAERMEQERIKKEEQEQKRIEKAEQEKIRKAEQEQKRAQERLNKLAEKEIKVRIDGERKLAKQKMNDYKRAQALLKKEEKKRGYLSQQIERDALCEKLFEEFYVYDKFIIATLVANLNIENKNEFLRLVQRSLRTLNGISNFDFIKVQEFSLETETAINLFNVSVETLYAYLSMYENEEFLNRFGLEKEVILNELMKLRK